MRILVALLFFFLATPCFPATYYICTGGDGSAPTDGTCANAYGQISDATIAQSGAHTYQLLSDIVETDACPIQDNDDNAIIDLNGFKASSQAANTNMFYADAGADNVTIKNGTLQAGNGNTSVSVTGNSVDGWIIEDVYFDGTGEPGYGIALYLTSGASTGMTVRRCVFYDVGESDTFHLLLGGDIGTLNIQNNVFIAANNHILLQDSDPGSDPTAIDVYNNTFYGGTDGIHCDAGTDCSVFTITNNIFHSISDDAVDDDSGGADPAFLVNAWYSNGTNCEGCTHDGFITTDPLLMAAGGDNAINHKIKHGSPCKNAGNDLSLYVTEDYLGNARPKFGIFDIGAFELGANLVLLEDD